jgi:heat shock protein HtpX
MSINRITGQIKTVLLLGTLTAIVVGAGTVAAPSYAWAFAIAGVAMNVGMWFFSDRMVLRTSGARLLEPAEAPDLHEMVGELARAAQIPAPKLYVIEAGYANAFATGRNPAHGAVAVTSGLLQALSRREVRGVIAHEIAHIRNRDVTIATVAAGLAAVISGVANALQFSAFFGGGQDDEDHGGNLLGSLAFALIAPIAASLVQLAISRSREYVADATAARLTGDPEALATALERLSMAAERRPAQVEPATASLYIVNPLTGGGLAGLFSTHPPMEERIARLRGPLAAAVGAAKTAGADAAPPPARWARPGDRSHAAWR